MTGHDPQVVTINRREFGSAVTSFKYKVLIAVQTLTFTYKLPGPRQVDQPFISVNGIKSSPRQEIDMSHLCFFQGLRQHWQQERDYQSEVTEEQNLISCPDDFELRLPSSPRERRAYLAEGPGVAFLCPKSQASECDYLLVAEAREWSTAHERRTLFSMAVKLAECQESRQSEQELAGALLAH
ncbi:hypothetical protein SISSUDRAFT_1033038 [Sistotremastrum suecicum HHB10207 ss-3]|uniref:Uncharacterized protein n=1 Tax=Sistotremastrum suecicum HHB10207 ss-3 TaxID=1314776 RepID=A0A166DTH8_9AGAM|nr:hypothetical protein SISSUDRAFT_1033038 [Sistotremastrum suecicum HHB10207 ss-3]